MVVLIYQNFVNVHTII